MIILLDFDYTLIDTEQCKRNLAEAMGVSWEQFLSTYKKSVIDGIYQIDKHLDMLGLNNESTKTKITECFKNIDKYLHEGAFELIKKFKERGDKVVVLTKGSKELQKMKINNSEINRLCEIIYTDRNKEEQLEEMKKLFGNEEIIIINDNSKEAAEMEKMIKHAKVYITDGPYADSGTGRRIYSINEIIKEEFPPEREINEFRRQLK